MYYLLKPKINERGEPVVRIPNKYEWYIDPYGEPTEMWLDMQEEIKKGTFGADEKFPILKLQKFEEDPFKEVREVYSKGKIAAEVLSLDAWKAIVKTMERLDEK